MVRMTTNQNLCVTVRWYLDILSTYHSTLRLFAKYRKAALTRFHRGLAKCQVEVSCNTDRVNVLSLNTLNGAATVRTMWSKCPHGTSCNVEDVSGEWRFVSFTTSTGHFDQLILGVPFSLHGFPAPFQRRFLARSCEVFAGYPMQTVFRFSRCGTGFGNKKSPHNNRNLTIPSGMALVRVCYVAIRKSKTCSGSFRSRAGTLR